MGFILLYQLASKDILKIRQHRYQTAGDSQTTFLGILFLEVDALTLLDIVLLLLRIDL